MKLAGYQQDVWATRMFLLAGPTLMEANSRVLQKEVGQRSTDGLDIRAGHSYREFDVSASTLPVNVYTRDVGEPIARGNVKSREYHPKKCAEFIVEGIIREKKSHMIASGWIVEATSDIEEIGEVSPFATPTLQPCEDLCAPLLVSSPVSGPDLPVITVANNRSRFQVFTAGQIYTAYRDSNEDLLNGNVANGTPNFERALTQYNNVINMSERWRNKPSPGEIAVSVLLETAD